VGLDEENLVGPVLAQHAFELGPRPVYLHAGARAVARRAVGLGYLLPHESPQVLQVISAENGGPSFLNSGAPSASAAPMRDPVTLCADAYAAWHASWLEALGLRSARREGVWRALDRPPHIYLAGITLDPAVPSDAVADVPGSVGDAWHALDLATH